MNPDQTAQVSSLIWVHIVCNIGYKSTKQAKHVVKAEKGSMCFICVQYLFTSHVSNALKQNSVKQTKFSQKQNVTRKNAFIEMCKGY